MLKKVLLVNAGGVTLGTLAVSEKDTIVYYGGSYFAADIDGKAAVIDDIPTPIWREPETILRTYSLDRDLRGKGFVEKPFAPTLPPVMTKEVAFVLALMPWTARSVCDGLRKGGQEIKTRAEDEMSAAKFFLLPFALQAGGDWLEKANAEIKDRIIKRAFKENARVA